MDLRDIYAAIPQRYEAVNRLITLGLDRPWYVQFAKFIKTFFVGDQYGWPGLGYTFSGQTSVLHLIIARAPRTLLLIAGASVIWLFSGVSIGVLSAVKRRTVIDALRCAGGIGSA